MKKQILLKQFEYSIPPSVNALTGIKRKVAGEHLSLMEIAIDFENGRLNLEGDWQFMMASNKQHEASWFSYHRERVKIETTIYPASAINLNDPCTDGLMFPLEGNIKDGMYLSACSGVLIVDNVRGNDDPISNQWNISCYIYDNQIDDCEINFNLPVLY
jgi:hypothetical protein